MVPLIFRVHSPPLQVSAEMLGQKPSITRQPMSCCSSSFATSSNDLSAVVVTTVLPFAFRIAATCISFPPGSVIPSTLACALAASSSVPLAQVIYAAFHLLLERLDRGGRHLGRERANFFGLGRERPQ